MLFLRTRREQAPTEQYYPQKDVPKMPRLSPLMYNRKSNGVIPGANHQASYE